MHSMQKAYQMYCSTLIEFIKPSRGPINTKRGLADTLNLYGLVVEFPNDLH